VLHPLGRRRYEDTSDDELIDLGAEYENRLAQIEAELSGLSPASRGLAKSALKFGVNTVLGVAGIVLAPPTGGLSLLVTAGSAGMMIWDGIDMGRDYFSPNRRRLRTLRSQASRVADELAAIKAILDARLSGSL
jgi:hypothetical protein